MVFVAFMQFTDVFEVIHEAITVPFELVISQ